MPDDTLPGWRVVRRRRLDGREDISLVREEQDGPGMDPRDYAERWNGLFDRLKQQGGQE